MYHDSYSPRQWLLNAVHHVLRGIDTRFRSSDYAMDAADVLLDALGRLDERPH